MNDHFEEIRDVKFSFFTNSEIKALGVVNITETVLSGPGSVYDIKLGPKSKDELCGTCELDISECPGHFGVIHIYPILHPLKEVRKRFQKVLQIFCYYCSRPKLTTNDINTSKLC